MLPWSVIARAGWPSATAAATTSPIRAAPSSIEYSVWVCRWTNDAPPSAVPWDPSANPYPPPVHRLDPQPVDELHACH